MIALAYPIVLAVFVALVIVLPMLRQYRATGSSGLVIQKRPNPFQRLIGASLVVVALGVTAWCVLYPLLGDARLGVWAAPLWFTIAGGALVFLGLVVIIVAQAQMGTSWRIGVDTAPTALVHRGLFRMTRNPIYAGMLLAVSGAALVSPAPWTVMGCLAAWLLIALQTRLEEQHLLSLHGESYRRYAAGVGRFLPWIGRSVGDI